MPGSSKNKGSAGNAARHRRAFKGARAGTMGNGLNLNIVLEQRWGDTQGPDTHPANVPRTKQIPF